MTGDVRLVAYLWHQRTAAVETRERLLALLASGADRLLIETCHRVELYAAVPADVGAGTWVEATSLGPDERASCTTLAGADAAAHLFEVAAGLDSTVAGETQILRQVRRTYLEAAAPHPLLARLFERALHVGREIRRTSGLSSERSVGSLAIDELVRLLPGAARATVLVVGAGEVGKLAVRSLTRRVGRVLVANRDRARAEAVAAGHGARAIALSEVAAEIRSVDAVVSAADTRGDVLTPAVLRPRLAAGPLVLIDIAVPRSVSAETRTLDGLVYRSIDDLPGAQSVVPAHLLQAARDRCAVEAERFVLERGPESGEAIRALRARADLVRTAKLERAMKRLGHLSERDRRIVTALSQTLTNALLHAPTVALRERGADAPDAGDRFDSLPR